MTQQRQQECQRGCVWGWFLRPLLLLITLKGCEACTNIGSTPTWNEFMVALADRENGLSPPFCSFTIEGDNCPPPNDIGYTVNGYLDLSCSDFGGGTGDGCIINCDHARINVGPFALMDMYSFDLGGSQDTFLVIGMGAEVFGSRMSFTNNGSLQNGVKGGAIRVEPSALLTLEAPVFRENKAGWGGAIYSQGATRIEGGDFSDNKANEDGGAIFMATESSLEVENSRFRRNRANRGGGIFTQARYQSGSSTINSNTWISNEATEIGPAICLAPNADLIPQEDNRGCGNSDSSITCDGIAFASNGDCVEFDQQCIIPPSDSPTASPTQAPTRAPTFQPSLQPSVSSAPSESPSRTHQPTVSPAPSLSSSPSSGPFDGESRRSLRG
eukprot:CAMPEP_0168739418 /NCGR_PEP_ID=MMETSP0724-20121128/11453_1 /TAXON_ID=265536 /ORGANISM="Amphiprora sp., Strain CCMP467" /LENGTH=384 /DNA_ID=CAMNT_0008786821 /DNA_START=280 /DNA_END=1434 /DNA_ORIENTATION=-